MTKKDALKITGNQPKWALRNMHLALSMCQSLNTTEENLRLIAATFLLKGK